MNGLEIVMDEATKLGHQITDDVAGYILWNHTGWPSVFSDADGITVEECIRKQVREAPWSEMRATE